MKEKLITVTRDELEQIILEETLKERHILFDIGIEDYYEVPPVRESKLYRNSVIISKTKWKKFLRWIEDMIIDFEQARNIIKVMEPVFREYHVQYEQEHLKAEAEQATSMDFDQYIKMAAASYDSDEFERTRELFEDTFSDSLDRELGY